MHGFQAVPEWEAELLKILVVDDSSFMRKHLKGLLKEAGHEVVATARDGKEGFDLYRELRPDLVIMDVTMRGVDGIQCARMIKEEYPEARILFMSLVKDPNVISEAKNLGSLGFIEKKDHRRLFDIMDKENIQG